MYISNNNLNTKEITPNKIFPKSTVSCKYSRMVLTPHKQNILVAWCGLLGLGSDQISNIHGHLLDLCIVEDFNVL